MPPEEGDATRCGVVALVGAPNAGKSTLVNALVGTKVAIVSPRAQTTRRRLTGIAVVGSAQLLLVDTPGIFAPRRRLDRAMVGEAWEGVTDADIVLLLVDAAKGLTDEVQALVTGLGEAPRAAGRPHWLALNKIDLLPRDRLLPLAARLNQSYSFAETLMISARSGDGVADLGNRLASAVPEGPWLFPEDRISDAVTSLFLAELTREQLYLQLREELPYAAAIEPEKVAERPDGALEVHQRILVDRDSQKAIVVGKGGSRVKAIGEAARRQMEEAMGGRVHLFLTVKAKPGWAEDRNVWRDIGMAWVD
jgi:GTP-binding protein Era